MASRFGSRKAPLLGSKEVFLPNFTLTLLRTPYLPASFASFLVPLNFNKLDLRDYLYNAYGVRVRGVRSYIQQQKVRQDKPGAKRPRPRQWFRPRAIKKMLVELERPFVWPEVPENFDKWDKKTFDAAREFQEKGRDSQSPAAKTKPNPERESIAEQAKRILAGDVKWKENLEWEDDGEAEEVEKDIILPKD